MRRIPTTGGTRTIESKDRSLPPCNAPSWTIGLRRAKWCCTMKTTFPRRSRWRFGLSGFTKLARGRRGIGAPDVSACDYRGGPQYPRRNLVELMIARSLPGLLVMVSLAALLIAAGRCVAGRLGELPATHGQGIGAGEMVSRGDVRRSDYPARDSKAYFGRRRRSRHSAERTSRGSCAECVVVCRRFAHHGLGSAGR